MTNHTMRLSVASLKVFSAMNAALAITGAILGTSQTKLYVELGLESLKARRSFRRLLFL